MPVFIIIMRRNNDHYSYPVLNNKESHFLVLEAGSRGVRERESSLGLELGKLLYNPCRAFQLRSKMKSDASLKFLLQMS